MLRTQDLVKRYDTKDAKCNELRAKLRTAKAALGSTERQLGVAQRMLQKASEEKVALRVR